VRKILKIDAYEDSSDVVVLLIGELDMSTVNGFAEVILDLCRSGTERRVVLDIGGLEFVDSTGLRAILTSRVLCSRSHCALAIEPLPERIRPQVRRLLEVTGLVDRLPFADDTSAG
jgi:anti-sigma B factor antagonist